MSLSLLALLTPPLTVLAAGRRLSDGAPLALVVTVVVTWCVAVALCLLLGGVDDIGARTLGGSAVDSISSEQQARCRSLRYGRTQLTLTCVPAAAGAERCTTTRR